jgi:hypothetical protein
LNFPKIIPRPLAEQIHTSKRNAIIHYDFLYNKKRIVEYEYILVLKCDLSNYVELVTAKTCDHNVVADGLFE